MNRIMVVHVHVGLAGFSVKLSSPGIFFNQYQIEGFLPHLVSKIKPHFYCDQYTCTCMSVVTVFYLSGKLFLNPRAERQLRLTFTGPHVTH